MKTTKYTAVFAARTAIGLELLQTESAQFWDAEKTKPKSLKTK